ncbi:triacylglycerol lipase [Vararia minispora EC-137]|uniref:Triacylglycerol lipase n=1 Tax=Vararia minispora EC-137 TaxID=1314806 RepID=A0ACB8QY46_9AGAM|nr:triacylglycerol lipase [Vararia minispora EC-137]
MSHIPFLGRLRLHEYAAVVLSLTLVFLESVLHIIIRFLPKPIIEFFYKRSARLFHRFVASPTLLPSPERRIADRVRKARDFEALCDIFGYQHEEHVVLTKDGYLLGVHRLPVKAGETLPRPGTSTGKPVVYLHHGLLMNSEVWVCMTDPRRSLPFVLAEAGFDVWLGNNRGNKYSKKSIHHNPNSAKFWDFSIDDFAWHDIPDTIDYILDVTGIQSLSYIGFSQGTAQAFAALSIHPQLNQKVNVFVALAPAMSPPGLSAPLVDGLIKASPSLIFLLFGRRAILSSAHMWQAILYPPIFVRVIDSSLTWLFRWRGSNISPPQKLAAYAHLYSFASTKSVVHWFQIMRHGRFLMYDDDVYHMRSSSGRSYTPVRFPTRNIATPIVLMYGDEDSLVDIDIMRRELPENNVEVRRLHGYEHVDVLWGQNVDQDVIPGVLQALRKYAEAPVTFEGIKHALENAGWTNGFSLKNGRTVNGVKGTTNYSYASPGNDTALSTDIDC